MKKFKCEYCNFYTDHKPNYDRHLNTKKHLNNIEKINNELKDKDNNENKELNDIKQMCIELKRQNELKDKQILRIENQIEKLTNIIQIQQIEINQKNSYDSQPIKDMINFYKNRYPYTIYSFKNFLTDRDENYIMNRAKDHALSLVYKKNILKTDFVN